MSLPPRGDHEPIPPGTLDMLILTTVARDGELPGFEIAEAIQRGSGDVLRVEEGSLYPALHRLELDGAISAKWGVSDNNRKAKYYSLTARGKKLLASEEDSWARLSAAVQRVLAR